jgi:lipopolysaccharide export system permease protein
MATTSVAMAPGLRAVGGPSTPVVWFGGIVYPGWDDGDGLARQVRELSFVSIMDRYLLRNFLIAYGICFLSLIGLYVVIDLFANADEFFEDHAGTLTFFRRVGKFYFVHSFEYFARLSPVITMVAAMTTLANLHRHNEIVALLAAGVPTRRALAPILVGALGVIGLGIANREMMLPRYSEVLQRLHEDIEADHALIPSMCIDKDKVLFRADRAFRDRRVIENVNLTFPVEITGVLQEVHCVEAFEELDPETAEPGWRLIEATAGVDTNARRQKIRKLPDGTHFVRTNVRFVDMIRRSNWQSYASTMELVDLLQKEEIKNPQDTRVLIHTRIMEPALHFLLVLLGLPFVLQWERRNVFAGIAVSMGLCGAFFVTASSASYLASYGYIDSMLAAWSPVLIFGPVAVSLFPRIGT